MDILIATGAETSATGGEALQKKLLLQSQDP
jgi:hypothetical protein